MSENPSSRAFPTGWYAIRPSAELRPGQVEAVRYFGRELVLYRTRGGEARLSEITCPHLGTSLATGRVRGEHLVCSRHGFEFDGEGRCAKVAGGSQVPAAARLGHLEVDELNGFIFAWHPQEGTQPSFQLEPLDWQGWTPLRHRRLEFIGHPQETTENSVDIGHFNAVHHYTATVNQEPVPDGAKLSARYSVVRPLLGTWDPVFKLYVSFRILAHGLGYSLVHAQVDGTPASFRYFINATPIDGERIHLNIAAATRKLAPGLDLAVREGAFRGLLNDVSQDIPFWESKQYVENPVLAKGDGPIPIYRRWCKQFYAETANTTQIAASV